MFLYLPGSYLDVEIASLVGDLEDLWPGKPIYPQPVAVYQEAVGADAQHDVNAFGILGVVEVDTIHREFLCILEEIHLRLCWSHSPFVKKEGHQHMFKQQNEYRR